MALLFLLSIVAAYFLVSRIARPLKQLAGYANELASTGPAVGRDPRARRRPARHRRS